MTAHATHEQAASRRMRFSAREEVNGNMLILDIVEIDMPTSDDPNAITRFRRQRNKLIESLTQRVLSGEIADYQTHIMG